MKRILGFLVFMLPIFLVAGAFTGSSSEIGQKDASTAFPPGKWNFSANPFMGEGYKTRPVVVTSVASEAITLSVTSVRINNISSKPVRAVKLGWALRERTDKSKILNQGETSLITMEEPLPANSNRILKLQVASFLELYKPLVKKGRLEGSYRLEVGVTQVLFDNQLSWRLGDPVAIRSTNVEQVVDQRRSNHASAFTVRPILVPVACAKQKCRHDGVPPPSYTCTGSEDDEFCTNCGQSCCNTICGQQPSCDCT